MLSENSLTANVQRRSWRRWAGVLVLFLLFAVFIAFTSRNREPSAAELQAELAGLNIGIANGEPMCGEWLYWKLPEPLHSWAGERRHAVHLGGVNVTDEHLEEWTRLTQLRNLSAPFSKVSDAGLEHVGRMPSLMGLELTGTVITDDGLLHIRKAVHLKELVLNDTAITDVGLMHLSG